MNPLQDQVNRLQNQLDELTKMFYLNNFSSHQDFDKSSAFNNVLKVPHYDSDPTSAEVGEIIEVGGVLKICSSANVFTTVGTQT